MNKLLLACGLLTATAAGAQNIPNPVIINVADIGVLKYNGKYYLGGCRTAGDFYISSDLTQWDGPIHVIDMDNDWSRGTACGNNQIHANDMLYDNGTVHAYWSVNHWGNDLHAVHVVHSEASDPMGPYAEPVKDRWMDNRIDPKVLRDDDGKLYMYMVRFTDGNTIWARKMDNWREFNETDPDAMVCQFASNPDTWERMDNAVAEGPWVMKYHGAYYMMYNANHTGGEWGNYQLGVARSTSPMGFNNANKYPHPVVLSNQTEVNDRYPDLLRYSGQTYTPMFAYDTSAYDGDESWTAPDYDDSGWLRGIGGFAPTAPKGTSTYRRGTLWDTNRIRLRKSFDLADTGHNLALRLTTQGPTKVYLNGTPVHVSDRGEYVVINLDADARRLLKPGSNLLAIESTGGKRGGYVNAELFDTRNETLDPEIVWTPGQPNILRGPNGMEWWLIYMANNNGIGRSQYVDRVYFHGDKLVVDGISHRGNPGYHPVPAKPTYGDTFDSGKLDTGCWTMPDTSVWSVTDGELRAVPADGIAATATLTPSMAAESYLWEVNVKPSSSAGIYAVYQDEKNNVALMFDKPTGTLQMVETLGGRSRVAASRPLRKDFIWDVYHQIRLERDMEDLIVSIDEMRIDEHFVTPLATAGIPGLIADGGQASFDGLIYTIGFDDGNDRMNGWHVSEGGLAPIDGGAAMGSGKLTALKGTPSLSYEFAAQLSDLGGNADSGIYPLYVDADNHISARINAGTRTLDLETVRKGKVVAHQSLPLDTVRPLYTDVRFTDFYDKGYTFDTPTLFDAIYLPRYDVDNNKLFDNIELTATEPTVGMRETVHDNMFDIVAPSYVTADGGWQSIPTDKATVDNNNPAFSKATFEPIEASRIRFINTGATDLNRHIYRILVHELFKDSYNLRAVRDENGILRIFVDGRQFAELPTTGFGSSVVGLDSHSGTPRYHGITYHHR